MAHGTEARRWKLVGGALCLDFVNTVGGRKTVASHMKEQTTFVFVGEERRTANHWILAPGVARIRRYRMTAGAKTVYYTFQLTGEGQVAQFSVVENP